MNLKGRIPVEPLDDERLTNIERRIVMGAADVAVAPHARASRFGVAFAVATVIVIAAGAGFAGWRLRGAPVAKPAPIAVAEPVRVHTTMEGSMLDIGDATIASDPLTEYAVTRPDGGVLVTMKRGKVELSVGKRGERPPLVVAAGETRVIVIGTKFSVDYGDGSGPVIVRVTEGVVRVERQQQDTRVAAGQAWSSSDKRGVVAAAELPETKLATIADGKHTDDAEIEIETKTPDVLRDHDATVPDAKLPTAKQPVAHKQVGPELATRPHETAAGSAALDLFSAVRSAVVLPPLDLGLRPEESISRYRQLTVEKKGEEASMAWYSIAAMQHLKLGRSGDALQTLDTYTRRFFGGQEAQQWASYKAALWLRVRILCSKSIDERCRQAAFTYMHQVTDTPQARIAEALTLAPR